MSLKGAEGVCTTMNDPFVDIPYMTSVGSKEKELGKSDKIHTGLKKDKEKLTIYIYMDSAAGVPVSEIAPMLRKMKV